MPVQGGPKARKGSTGQRRRGTAATRVVRSRRMAGMSTRAPAPGGQGGRAVGGR